MFPMDNADARSRDVEVGADLQRIRARSKAMLSMAGLVMPQLPGIPRGPLAEAPEIDEEGGVAMAMDRGALLGQDKPAGTQTREVPIAASMGVDLQF